MTPTTYRRYERLVTRWTPLLVDEDAARARNAIAAIANALRDGDIATPGLTRGAAGVALFFGYLGMAQDDDAAMSRASALLERAVVGSAGNVRDVSLGDGLAGIGWTLEHLAGADISSLDDPNRTTDAVLARLLATEPWTGPYDLLRGLCGIGVYALERLPRASAEAMVARVIDHLATEAREDDHGLSWSSADVELPDSVRGHSSGSHVNLGCAHGVPAVIGLVGRAIAAGVASERARPLLDGAVSWLLAQRLEGEDARYARWAIGGVGIQPTRSAWCYGDPGIALTLLAAADAAENAAWRKAAIELLDGVAARTPERCEVEDACLCHGAFGLAHLFLRGFHNTGEARYATAATGWLQRGLDLRQSGRAIAGFPHRTESAPDGWEAERGLLFGAAGVGLVLLGATSEIEPAWDRALMLDV